jgi:hypothetical protein
VNLLLDLGGVVYRVLITTFVLLYSSFCSSRCGARVRLPASSSYSDVDIVLWAR